MKLCDLLIDLQAVTLDSAVTDMHFIVDNRVQHQAQSSWWAGRLCEDSFHLGSEKQKRGQNEINIAVFRRWKLDLSPTLQNHICLGEKKTE